MILGTGFEPVILQFGLLYIYRLVKLYAFGKSSLGLWVLCPGNLQGACFCRQVQEIGCGRPTPRRCSGRKVLGRSLEVGAMGAMGGVGAMNAGWMSPETLMFLSLYDSTKAKSRFKIHWQIVAMHSRTGFMSVYHFLVLPSASTRSYRFNRFGEPEVNLLLLEAVAGHHCSDFLSAHRPGTVGFEAWQTLIPRST